MAITQRAGWWRGAGRAALAIGALTAAVSLAGAGDWPQFRGAERDGVSDETGLLKSWPEGGPQVVWRVPLGEGFSGLSVVVERIYTLFSRKGGADEFLVALNALNGEEIWRRPIGPGESLAQTPPALVLRRTEGHSQRRSPKADAAGQE